MAPKKKSNGRQSQFLSLSSKSKQEFIQEYNKYDEPKKRDLYCKISREIEIFISQGNLDQYKKLNKLLIYIAEIVDKTILEEYEKDENNPLRNTNPVILACKYNQVDILNHILDVEKNNASITPNATDDANHNGFYYAIRSNNTNLLDMLVNRWPGNYFADDPQALDDILSQAYEELKLKNVPLSEEMEFFVESKLINLRFFSESQKKHKAAPVDLKTIIERIELVIENIHLLREEYLNIEEMDEKFFFIATFIAQNINILKRQLKSTYDRLPWEEIEFCLVCYISSHTKQEEMNFFYRTTLNKTKMLSYLQHFAQNLEQEKSVICKSENTGNLTDLPFMKREKVVSNITKKNPQFGELYNDFHSLRDIHSLQKINDYIKLALSANAKDIEGQLIIRRVLQLIGEHFKNTLESPKLSVTTSELLLLSLPENTRKIVVDLRKSLSHVYDLHRNLEILDSKSDEFYIQIKDDIKIMEEVISNIMCDKKLKNLRILWKTILDCESTKDFDDFAEILSKINLRNIIFREIQSDYQRLEKIVTCLRSYLNSSCEALFLIRVDTFLMAESHDINESLEDDIIKRINDGLSALTYFKMFIKDHACNITVKMQKSVAAKALIKTSPHFDINKLNFIAGFMMQIFNSAQCTFRDDIITMDKIRRLILEFFHLYDLRLDDDSKSKELKDKLVENISTENTNDQKFKNIDDQSKKYTIQEEDRVKLLAKKLTLLKNFMEDNGLTDDNIMDNIASYMKNEKLYLALEMLVLDIMLLSCTSASDLQNNCIYFSNNTFLLNGKSLCSPLAHDDILVNTFFQDPKIAVIMNAKILTSKNKNIVNDIKEDHEHIVLNNFSRIRERYSLNLATVENQDKLFSALEIGRIEDVKKQIMAGADIKARNVMLNRSVLHFACKGSSLDCFKLLLEYNPEMNIKDLNGQTPLHIAATYGRINILKLILGRGNVCIDDQDNDGQTALHRAARNGHKDFVTALVKNEASVHIQDRGGYPALCLAVKNKHADIAKILWKEDSGTITNNGVTPLHIAAHVGLTKFINFLLLKEVDIDRKDFDNHTPLFSAASHGQSEIVQILISKGAEVDSKNINGVTPLRDAVDNGQETVAKVLIQYGADVNSKDRIDQETPLHSASESGFENIVRLLVSNNANINATSSDGKTPLHCAARNGHVAIVDYLLQHGANIQAKQNNNDYLTPLELAVSNGQTEVVDLLLSNKNQNKSRSVRNELLCLAAAQGHKETVKLLIQKGAAVNSKILGNTPLHLATRYGNTGAMDALLKNNAEIQTKDMNDFTTLQLACTRGHFGAVKTLLEHNADPNAECNNSFPLHIAIYRRRIDIVKLLLENNANVNKICMERESPLLMAVESGQKEIVQMLIENGGHCKEKSLLSIAAKNNDKEMVNLLIEYGITNYQDKVDQWTENPLFIAICSRNKYISKLILNTNIPFDVNVNTDKGVTLLHIASQYLGDEDIVNGLISRGAVVDAGLIEYGFTPLCGAIQGGNKAIVEILIENGADVNILGGIFNPLLLAVEEGRDDIVEVILQNGALINIGDDGNGFKPLEVAVLRSHLKIVNMILQSNKIDINSKWSADCRLLHFASKACNLGMVEFLVDQGADMNAIDSSGLKPIHIAARVGFKSGVEFYISKGMNVNERDSANRTLLHHSTANVKLDLLEYLISQGADINAKSVKNLTPMHMAAMHGNLETVKILLKHGGDFTALSASNVTPLNIAQSVEVIVMLRLTENLFEAIKLNEPYNVKKLCKSGAFVNARRADGQTSLHFASERGFDNIVEILLENNADPNVTCNKNMTPLHYATKFSHYKVVITLLSNGSVYESLSENKEQCPLEIGKDSRILKLIDLIKQSFQQIADGNVLVIKNLNSIDNVEIVRAVLGACNGKKETLVVAAMRSDFPKIEELKAIHQGDAIKQIIFASMLIINAGDKKIAYNMLSKVLKTRKDILGSNNPGTLDIQKQLSEILYKMGSFEEALILSKEVFKKQYDTLSFDHPDTLYTAHLIALIQLSLRRDEKALDIFQEVYPKQVTILGLYHSDTLDTQLGIAVALNRLGKYTEALQNIKLVLEKRENTSDENKDTNLNHLLALECKANILCNQRKYKEALKIFNGILVKKMNMCGKNDVGYLETMNTIPKVLIDLGNFEEALQKYHEVLEAMKNALGKDHSKTLNVQYSIAKLYFRQGKKIKSLKVLEKFFYKTAINSKPSHIDILELALVWSDIKAAKDLDFPDINIGKIIKYVRMEMNTAIQEGNVQELHHILKDGADINDRDEDGRTPLHFAVNSGKETVVKFLLKNGADVTLTTNKGNTPLHTATNKSDEKLVNLLLKHTSQKQIEKLINAKTTGSGTTALHIAASINAIDIVISLLKRGAVYNIGNNLCKTPVDLATEPEIIHLFKLVQKMFEQTNCGNSEAIRKLKKVESDTFAAVTNARDDSHKTLLQVAISKGHRTLVTLLLDEMKKE